MKLDKFFDLIRKHRDSKFVGYNYYDLLLASGEERVVEAIGTDLDFVFASSIMFEFSINGGSLISQSAPMRGVESRPFHKFTIKNNFPGSLVVRVIADINPANLRGE